MAETKHPRNNAAARLHAIVELAHKQRDDVLTLATWALILLNEDKPDHLSARRVAVRLENIQQQVDILEEFLQTELSPEMYSTEVAYLRHALLPTSFGERWVVVKQKLDPGVRTMLRMSTGLMPADSLTTMTDSEVADLRSHVDQLQSSVLAADLPDTAKTALAGQLQIIENAIAEYPVKGDAAFRDASTEWVQQWGERASDLEPNAAHPVVKDVRGVWAKIVVSTRHLVRISLTTAALLGGWEAAIQLIGHFTLEKAEQQVGSIVQSSTTYNVGGDQYQITGGNINLRIEAGPPADDASESDVTAK